MNNYLKRQVQDALFEARVPLAPLYRYFKTKYGTDNVTGLSDEDGFDILENLTPIIESINMMVERENKAVDDRVYRIKTLRAMMTDREQMVIGTAYNKWRAARAAADSAPYGRYAKENDTANALWRVASALETKILAEVAARLDEES